MKKNKLTDLFHKEKILLDGAMGSILIEKGLKTDDVPELWNISKADEIIAIHDNYIKSGADAVLSNTFGASPMKLGERGIENVSEIIHKSVENAKSTSNIVIGDIGPTGKFLPPMGNISEEKLFTTYKKQAKILIDAGVDAILIETMYDLREAIAAVRSVRSVDKDILIMATMTFDRKKSGYFTIMGDTPNKAYTELEKAGADVVGANCTLGPEDMIELARISRNITVLPLLFQANAGQPEISKNGVNYPLSVDSYAKSVIKLFEYVDIIGGCCGTTPEYIQKIREQMV